MILYYALFAIVGFIVEAEAVQDPKSRLRFQNEMESYKKRKGDNPDNEPPTGVWVHVIYFLLTILGILTVNWFMFVVLIIMGFIPKKSLGYIRFDGILSLIIIVLIVLNKYQFHIHFNQLWK